MKCLGPFLSLGGRFIQQTCIGCHLAPGDQAKIPTSLEHE